MKIGIVTATNTSKCQARVKFEDSDGIVSAFLPKGAERGIIETS